MIGKIKRITRTALRTVGLEYIGAKKCPSYALLGIRSMQIKTILDIGANKGQFAQKILHVFPNAKLICFEPLPSAFEELEAWKKSVGSTDIELVNVALGDEEGEVDMCLHLEHSASSSILQTTKECEDLYPVTRQQRTIKVPLTTLDQIVSQNSMSLEGGLLIKLDVQGFEDKVIRGGKEVISKAQALILEVSLVNLYQGQVGFEELVEILSNLGFCYSGTLEQYYADDGKVVFFDAVFFKKSKQ